MVFGGKCSKWPYQKMAVKFERPYWPHKNIMTCVDLEIPLFFSNKQCNDMHMFPATVEDYDWKPLVQNSSSNRLTSRSSFACQMQLLMAINSKQRLKLNEFVSFEWVASQCTNLVYGCSRLPFKRTWERSLYLYENPMESAGWIPIPVTRAMKRISQNYPTAWKNHSRDFPHIYIWLMEEILHHQGCIKPSK